MSQLEPVSERFLRLLSETSRRASGLHTQFLESRGVGLQDMRSLIELQIKSAHHPATVRPALFDSQQLDAFGRGRLSDCLGPEFARYDLRRIPRIPNGDLKMMSRIMQISGQPFSSRQAGSVPQQASVTAEYDVPHDCWYLRDNASPQIPLSLWMEIALQPCGFLSAYLDTYSLVPHQDFFFRNLDGSANLLEHEDLRGETITTHARMVTSVVSAGTVIQKFMFELSCQGKKVYQGESTFGYFSASAMASQNGLDQGRPVLPWLRSVPGAENGGAFTGTQRWQAASPDRSHYHLSTDQMHYLPEVFVSRTGGKYDQGYVYASVAVDPSAWYYPCHFYQDPVMPGSLGVEAIVQAMQAYVLENDLGNTLRSPRFGLPTAQPMLWRYRGQIVPTNRQMELEVHLNTPQILPGQVNLSGDASLWVDGLRIYELKNVAVAVQEG
jgi:3-hydroxymyristoyl/3-hydroxydecanoyl-(acyl carrier protein) dehydratase